MIFENFVDVCSDAHDLLLRPRLAQLAWAMCVGQQCLPSMQPLSLACLQWSRGRPP